MTPSCLHAKPFLFLTPRSMVESCLLHQGSTTAAANLLAIIGGVLGLLLICLFLGSLIHLRGNRRRRAEKLADILFQKSLLWVIPPIIAAGFLLERNVALAVFGEMPPFGALPFKASALIMILSSFAFSSVGRGGMPATDLKPIDRSWVFMLTYASLLVVFLSCMSIFGRMEMACFIRAQCLPFMLVAGIVGSGLLFPSPAVGRRLI